MERETQLLNDTGAASLLQPGLFDQRVVRNAAAIDGRLSELRAETQRRIDRLLMGAVLKDRLEIRAVLIVWSERHESALRLAVFARRDERARR